MRVIQHAYYLAILLEVAAGKLTFNSVDGTFKIVHLSDIHYEIGPMTPCRNVPSSYPCSGQNSTDFIRRVLAMEKPDLVVFTGDVIDWATHPAAAGMDDVYSLPPTSWAATLGNHDAQSDLSRSSVMEHVVGMPRGLSQVNALGSGPTEAFGNFVLDVFRSSNDSSPAFRTFHLDSTTHEASISAAQVGWFEGAAVKGGAVPALLFTHVPLEEFDTAVRDGRNVSGSWNEKVSYQPVNSGLFGGLSDAGVVGVFCGHDHTNDFCALHKGVQLCYEGSPGYQAYGRDGFARRVRVTQLAHFGGSVHSWKRLDDPTLSVVDREMLWAHPQTQPSIRAMVATDAQRRAHGVSDPDALPDVDQWGSASSVSSLKH